MLVEVVQREWSSAAHPSSCSSSLLIRLSQGFGERPPSSADFLSFIRIMAEKLYQILPDGVALESAEFAARLDALPSIGAATRELYELPTRGNIHAEGSSGERVSATLPLSCGRADCSPVNAVRARPDEPCIYLAGNSLGCLPKKARKLMNEELDVWGSRSVRSLPLPLPSARPSDTRCPAQSCARALRPSSWTQLEGYRRPCHADAGRARGR